MFIRETGDLKMSYFSLQPQMKCLFFFGLQFFAIYTNTDLILSIVALSSEVCHQYEEIPWDCSISAGYSALELSHSNLYIQGLSLIKQVLLCDSWFCCHPCKMRPDVALIILQISTFIPINQKFCCSKLQPKRCPAILKGQHRVMTSISHQMAVLNHVLRVVTQHARGKVGYDQFHIPTRTLLFLWMYRRLGLGASP